MTRRRSRARRPGGPAGTPGAGAAEQVRHDPPQRVTVGAIDLCSDAFGDPRDPVLLHVTGLGMQRVHWP